MECREKLFTDTAYFLGDASNSLLLNNCIASALLLTPSQKNLTKAKREVSKRMVRLEGVQGGGWEENKLSFSAMAHATVR
jgi:hypothetical protein